MRAYTTLVTIGAFLLGCASEGAPEGVDALRAEDAVWVGEHAVLAEAASGLAQALALSPRCAALLETTKYKTSTTEYLTETVGDGRKLTGYSFLEVDKTPVVYVSLDEGESAWSILVHELTHVALHCSQGDPEPNHEGEAWEEVFPVASKLALKHGSYFKAVPQ